MQDDHEFIAAQARDRVRLANATLNPLRNLNQQKVSRLVSVPVIDGLEVIQVEVNQGKPAVRSLRLNQSVRQAFVKFDSVGQAGEQVKVGQLEIVLL